MNTLKKYLGILWIVLGPALVAFMCWQAYEKISASDAAHKTNTILQWGIIMLVFIPICIGIVIFGYYALKNEYSHLPESSKEL